MTAPFRPPARHHPVRARRLHGQAVGTAGVGDDARASAPPRGPPTTWCGSSAPRRDHGRRRAADSMGEGARAARARRHRRQPVCDSCVSATRARTARSSSPRHPRARLSAGRALPIRRNHRRSPVPNLATIPSAVPHRRPPQAGCRVGDPTTRQVGSRIARGREERVHVNGAYQSCVATGERPGSPTGRSLDGGWLRYETPGTTSIHAGNLVLCGRSTANVHPRWLQRVPARSRERAGRASRRRSGRGARHSRSGHRRDRRGVRRARGARSTVGPPTSSRRGAATASPTTRRPTVRARWSRCRSRRDGRSTRPRCGRSSRLTLSNRDSQDRAVRRRRASLRSHRGSSSAAPVPSPRRGTTPHGRCRATG